MRIADNTIYVVIVQLVGNTEPGRISPAGNMVFPQELLAPGIQDLL